MANDGTHPAALTRQLHRWRAIAAVELAERRVQSQWHLDGQQVPEQLQTLQQEVNCWDITARDSRSAF